MSRPAVVEFSNESLIMPECDMPECERTSTCGWRLTCGRWVWFCRRHNQQYEAGCVMHLPGDRDVVRRRPRAKAMQFT